MMSEYIGKVTERIEINTQYDSHLGFPEGDYTIIYDQLDGKKDQEIRVRFIEAIKLGNMLKVLPKGSLCKSIKRMR